MFFAVSIALLLPPPAPPSSFRLATEPARRVACTLHLQIHAPDMSANEWALIAPLPPRLPGQSEVRAALLPEGRPAKDLTELKRHFLLARVPVRSAAQRRTLDVKWSVEATLHSRRLLPVDEAGQAPAADLTDEQRRVALSANSIVDHLDADFRRWLANEKLVRDTQEDDLAFARRAFLFLRGRGSYEYKKNMDRRASIVCRTGRSDCGGHAALFVAVLRANQVPARVLIGRWAQSSKENEKLEGLDYFQTHVKAEFFAKGIGWVPVDLSLAVTNKEAPPLGYFGNDTGSFLACHVDHDLKVDTQLFGTKTIDGLQGIHYFASGSGTFDGHSVKERWEVKPLPLTGSKSSK